MLKIIINNKIEYVSPRLKISKWSTIIWINAVIKGRKENEQSLYIPFDISNSLLLDKYPAFIER